MQCNVTWEHLLVILKVQFRQEIPDRSETSRLPSLDKLVGQADVGATLWVLT